MKFVVWTGNNDQKGSVFSRSCLQFVNHLERDALGAWVVRVRYVLCPVRTIWIAASCWQAKMSPGLQATS